MVEYRKLISFGKSSYVISLPKSWVDKSKLNKGSLVSVREEAENLLLSPKLEEEKAEVKEITINVDGKEYNQIRREIIPAYINNYHAIHLVGTELVGKAAMVREILHNLMALEIMEQTSDKIIAKDFVNMEKVNIMNLIHKMDVIARSMLQDVRFDSTVPHENITQRDEDVNRMAFLLFRAIKYAFNSPVALKEYKATCVQLLNYWSVISALEQFSDQIKRLARQCDKLNLPKIIQDKLGRILLDIRTSFETIMTAFYKNDKSMAYKVAAQKSHVLDKCDEAYTAYWRREHVPLLLEKLKNMALEVHNIARVVYS